MVGERGSCFGRITFLERVDGRYADATGVVTMRNLRGFDSVLVVVDSLRGSWTCSRDLIKQVLDVVDDVYASSIKARLGPLYGTRGTSYWNYSGHCHPEISRVNPYKCC